MITHYVCDLSCDVLSSRLIAGTRLAATVARTTAQAATSSTLLVPYWLASGPR